IVPRPAGEPRRRRGVRARQDARLLHLQRRLRAGDGTAVHRDDRLRRVRGRRRPRETERGTKRRRRGCAGRQRIRRAARAGAAGRALRHDRPRSAGIREEQGRDRERDRRLQGDQPARAEAAESRRDSRHLQLLLPRQRGRLRRDRLRRQRRRAGACHGRREADAGTRSPGPARRAGDVLLEVFHPAETAVAGHRHRVDAGFRRRAANQTMIEPLASVTRAARDAKKALARLARPAGDVDASRYFRGAVDLGFYNVGTASMRALARSIHDAHRGQWPIGDAMAFADALLVDRHLEVRALGSGVVARYRQEFAPDLLPVWKRWLAGNHAANWATTDAICGALIGPLLVRHPRLAVRMRGWSRDRNMWVRRASIVSLIPLARTGESLDLVYDVALRLHADREDLIQKAVGWALREAGKTDARRLERHLRANG